ncbi:GNAT family N-acetyltransferase [Yoonia sp. MH D7]
MILTNGIAPEDRAKVAALYWEAFGTKLGRVMRPEWKARAFIEQVLDTDHAICAHDTHGTLLGVAGFKTYEGALVDGTLRELAQHYGWVGATWRIALLSLLERDTENKRFLMDGIFVDEAARGKGVGSALLRAIIAEGRRRGYAEVRLDVIDTNPRARALYERMGFVAKDTHSLGPLRHLFGFSAATTMVREV